MTVHAPLRRSDRPRRVKLTVGDYLQLDEAGAFEAYGKTELIEGAVIAMSAEWVRHSRVKATLAGRLYALLERGGRELQLLIEPSVRGGEHNLPQPDLVLAVPGDDLAYQASDSVRLAIEVSDSTLAHDLKRKAKLYARLGFPEYWVFDLRGAVVHRFAEPSLKGWGRHDELQFGGPIASLTIEKLELDSSGLI